MFHEAFVSRPRLVLNPVPTDQEYLQAAREYDFIDTCETIEAALSETIDLFPAETARFADDLSTLIIRILTHDPLADLLDPFDLYPMLSRLPRTALVLLHNRYLCDVDETRETVLRVPVKTNKLLN